MLIGNLPYSPNPNKNDWVMYSKDGAHLLKIPYKEFVTAMGNGGVGLKYWEEESNYFKRYIDDSDVVQWDAEEFTVPGNAEMVAFVDVETVYMPYIGPEAYTNPYYQAVGHKLKGYYIFRRRSSNPVMGGIMRYKYWGLSTSSRKAPTTIYWNRYDGVTTDSDNIFLPGLFMMSTKDSDLIYDFIYQDWEGNESVIETVYPLSTTYEFNGINFKVSGCPSPSIYESLFIRDLIWRDQSTYVGYSNEYENIYYRPTEGSRDYSIQYADDSSYDVIKHTSALSSRAVWYNNGQLSYYQGGSYRYTNFRDAEVCTAKYEIESWHLSYTDPFTSKSFSTSGENWICHANSDSNPYEAWTGSTPDFSNADMFKWFGDVYNVANAEYLAQNKDACHYLYQNAGIYTLGHAFTGIGCYPYEDGISFWTGYTSSSSGEPPVADALARIYNNGKYYGEDMFVKVNDEYVSVKDLSSGAISHFGSDVPSDAIGTDGDLYFKTYTGQSYKYLKFEILGQKTAGTAYTQLAEIKFVDSNSNAADLHGVNCVCNKPLYTYTQTNEMMFDGFTQTKGLWVASPTTLDPIIITCEFYEPLDISVYSTLQLWTANDAEARDPQAWRFSVSNDKTNWTQINHESNYTLPSNRQVLGYSANLTIPSSNSTIILATYAKNDGHWIPII